MGQYWANTDRIIYLLCILTLLWKFNNRLRILLIYILLDIERVFEVTNLQIFFYEWPWCSRCKRGLASIPLRNIFKKVYSLYRHFFSHGDDKSASGILRYTSLYKRSELALNCRPHITERKSMKSHITGICRGSRSSINRQECKEEESSFIY